MTVKESFMADPVNNAQVIPAPAKDAPAANPFEGKTLDGLNGQEAEQIVAEAKAAGKTPEEILKMKQGVSAAPAQSGKESVKDAAAQAAAKRKMKIDNEEIDEDEVIKIYKARKLHQSAASKELNEGKQLRKQAEDFISMMKDPAKLHEVIAKLGHDPRKVAEEYLVTQLKDEMLDPREKELRDAKNKLKYYDELEAKQKAAIEQQRADEMKAKYADDYTKQFVSALQETGLPPNKAMVAEMAKYIARSAKIGFKMNAAEAAQLVKQDIQAAHQRLIGDSDGDTLIKLLGEDVANKIRKYDTAKLKDPNQYLRTPEQSQEPRRERNQGNKRMTPKEWAEFKRKK
jgi:hypothetical protein